MTTSSTEKKATTKVMAMADNVVVRRNIYKRTPLGDKPREFGRLDKSIDDLAESVEKYRHEGAQP